MTRRLLGRAIFLRHGQTNYTDIPPDLTEEGIQTITNSAELLKPLVEGHPNVAIIASPIARAQGSAAVIAEILRHKGKIRTETAIQAAIIKDRQLTKALLNEHASNGGIRALSVAYGTDPRYEDGKIIEPRSEVEKRFLGYFAHMVRSLLINTDLPPYLVHVSHYEVLYRFVEQLFGLDYKKDEPLSHGEIIMVLICDIDLRYVVEIEVTFRGKTTRRKLFDYNVKKIR